MSHVLRSLVMVALLAPMGPLAAAESPARATDANQNRDEGSASPESDSSAEKSLRTGIRAYASGELKQAIASLSAALQAGLDSNQSARALLYRGLTYRKQGMPGLAVSDLTNALQQQDGLSDAERTDAEHNRAAASREAGLPDTETVVVTLSPREVAQSRSPASVVPAPKPSENKSIVTGALAPVQEPRPVNSDWGAPKVAVAALLPVVETPTAFATRVAAVMPQPVATVVPEKVAAVAPDKKPEPPRDVHLQIASVRSPSEAFALSVRLTSQYGGEFGGHRLAVSKTLAENQGTTYRLLLGPYANAEEPQKLCASLRVGGYECVVE